ncbi:MAG: MFS transporter [Thermoanaerobaculia bacterium]
MVDPPRPRGLWGHRDFLRLWAAQAVSAMGSRITRTALPVLAVLSLSGSPTQVAVVAALSMGPGALVGLFAGGFVDRHAKRPVLIGCDLVRAAAVATLPLAAWYGRLTIVQIAAVAVVVGAATALFQMADVAFLPALVERARLIEGNTKLQTTEAVAEIVGPAAGGGLIQALGAPLAVLLDALSYLWSALWLGRIAGREKLAAAATTSDGPAWRELGSGLAFAWRERRLRPLLASTVVLCLYSGIFLALYSLYLLRDLRLSTATLGWIIGMGGVGALAGTFVGPRLMAAIGLGRALAATLAGNALALALIPLAGLPGLPRFAVVALLAVNQLVGDCFLMIYMVYGTSLRQAIVPGDRLARVNGAFQIVTGGLMPLVALLAGPLAETLGARGTFWGAAGAACVAPFLLWFSPLRGLANLPLAEGEAPPASSPLG